MVSQNYLKVSLLLVVTWTLLQIYQNDTSIPLNRKTVNYRWDNINRSYLQSEEYPRVTICTLSKSQNTWHTFTDSTPVKYLLPSINKTIKNDKLLFRIDLMIGVDKNDDYWNLHHERMIDYAKTNYDVNITFKYYQPSSTLPFNALMQDALQCGAEYLVRVNDDTEFITSDWVSKSINTLKEFHPPNIGVVGPTCQQGNTGIMTHDMVHRTHLKIFETYYPVVFHNWFVDDWISTVYGNSRTTKMVDWEVMHHIELGTRYKPSKDDRRLLEFQVKLGRARIDAFLDKINSLNQRVIAFSLYGENERYTQGAIENAKIYKEIYPGWSMLVYHDATVPKHILSTLKSHDVWLNDMSQSSMNKMSWRFTAAYNKISLFCSRDIDSRLSLREKYAVDEWIVSGQKYHVMRDHPSHSKYAMSGGMWCASTEAFSFISEKLKEIAVEDSYLKDMDWLNEHIWNDAKDNVVQHDSFSCDEFMGAKPFPTLRIGWEHVGSVYINGEMRENDINILRETTPPSQCIPNNTKQDTFLLYILNIPTGTKCKHMSNLNPLVCISTTEAAHNIVKVDIEDNWNQLGQRMLLALGTINEKFKASWYFKIDTDTAVDTLLLEAALHALPENVSYVGQVYLYNNKIEYASGGAGYGIRNDALALIADSHCPLIPSAYQNYEDVTVGNCLYQHGVTVTQLDGLYGDDAKTSSLLAAGVLVYPNYKFPVLVKIPAITIHRSNSDFIGSTIEQYNNKLMYIESTLAKYTKKNLFHVFEGQLGNQLFQYASVLGIASSNNMTACLNNNELIPWFDGVESHVCTIYNNTLVMDENQHYAIYQKFYLQHDVILNGFFQSYRYFPDNIRDLIQIKQKFKEQAKLILTQFPKSTRVAVHIRKKHSSLGYLRMPGASYYKKAMAYLNVLYSSVIFVIISDDTEWCHTQPYLKFSNVYIHDKKTSPVVDMALIAECDHVILSRGTFGWWGAYLGPDSRNGSVLYSDSEFDMMHPINKGHVNFVDFYPTNWISIRDN